MYTVQTTVNTVQLNRTVVECAIPYNAIYGLYGYAGSLGRLGRSSRSRRDNGVKLQKKLDALSLETRLLHEHVQYAVGK